MTDFFTKSPSNFFRIPESRYYRQNAASEVYEFLLDMAYRKDSPFFGNKRHTESVAMAENYKKGHVSCFTSVAMIMKYRGLTRNTVHDALRKLRRLGLIRFEIELDDADEPWKKEGMIYRVAERVKDENGKFTDQELSYLDQAGQIASTPAGAKKIQAALISVFKPGAEPMEILNLRFADVDTKVVKATKQPRAGKKQPKRKPLQESISFGVSDDLDEDNDWIWAAD